MNDLDKKQAQKEYQAAYRAKNREKRLKYLKAYYTSHKEQRAREYQEKRLCILAAKKQARIENPEKYRTIDKAQYVKHQAKRIEKSLRWAKEHPARVCAKNRARHAAKLQRTPKWLTPLHYKQIQLFYDAAHALTKELGVQMEVDHIVPLQGKNVSGLHVPWNLQVLTESKNASKGNRFGG